MEREFQAVNDKMKAYYETGITLPRAFRLAQLKRLKKAILDHEQELYNALKQDLKKSPEETWVTEIGFVISEINMAMNSLKDWMKPERVPTNLVNFPSRSYVLREPLGVVLLIGPWNYPFQLLFTPLVGAISAGNCIVMKPSEFAPATIKVMAKMIVENFPPEYIFFVQGDGSEIVPALLQRFQFNHIFFTGSTTTGKKIYQMAAAQLIPVTLELGGKSPCVVENDANLKVAARRIVQTKFSNAGQMCVAADYVLVQEGVRAELIELLKQTISKFYSDDPSTSYTYGKIINQKHFDRLVLNLQQVEILHGGKVDREKLYIEPTLVEIPSGKADHPFATEEIFGPILPIITFDNFDDAKSIIKRNPDPLAFYVFTSSKSKEKRWLESIAFGGGCVNNASWHLTNPNLPFGGRGKSGIGNYHGRNSFEVFTHRKAIMKTPTWFDPALKYPPFKGKLGIFKKIIR